jgi:hypothetical protein
MLLIRWHVVTAGLVMAAACACNAVVSPFRATCDPNASPNLDAARRDSIGPGDPHDVPDTHWAEVARRFPGGFAGVYLEDLPRDANGNTRRPQRFVVRFVRPKEGRAQLSRLLPAISRDVGGILIDSASVVIEPAQWDFAQLDEWRRYLSPRLGVRGISMTDADEAANRVVYGVVSDAARDTVRARLRALRAPCGLVELKKMDYPLLGR